MVVIPLKLFIESAVKIPLLLLLKAVFVRLFFVNESCSFFVSSIIGKH